MADKKANRALWDSVCETDPDYTKPVAYGARKFTALDAYRQILAATEQWGPVGKGWGWTAEFILGEGLCVAVLQMWHSGDRALTFTTVGSAALLKSTKNGMVADDDAAKKALTDAITKGLSYLGFNADVFLGKFDDNKYVESMRNKFANQHRPDHAGDPTGQSGQAADGEIASSASLKMFHARGVEIWGKDEWEKARRETVVWASNGRVEHSAEMNQAEMNAALDYLESQKQPTGGQNNA
jgi:hypothetical protein